MAIYARLLHEIKGQEGELEAVGIEMVDGITKAVIMQPGILHRQYKGQPAKKPADIPLKVTKGMNVWAIVDTKDTLNYPFVNPMTANGEAIPVKKF